MRDIIVQLAISVAGGLILNIIWDFCINRRKENGRPHLLMLHKAKDVYDIFRNCHPKVTKLITYVVLFCVLHGCTEIYRTYNNLNKDWINFKWIVFQDDKIGNNYLSANYEVYAYRGMYDREVVVRQVYNKTLVQVYETDFDIEKPNVFFSENYIYGLVTENGNGNLFNNKTGKLVCSFKVKGEEVYSTWVLENKQEFFLISFIDRFSSCIAKYDMITGKCVDEIIWEDAMIIAQTADLKYYLGAKFDNNLLFAVNLSDLEEEPIYGADALRLCTNGVFSFLFDREGKYYLDISINYTTGIEVKECASNKTIYNFNVYNASAYYFDDQDNLYVIYKGYVDKINLLTRERKTIIDLSTIAQRKNENRVKEDYVFVASCLIDDSRYLAGIVYEPSNNYYRIYILDMNTEQIVAMSNSLGVMAEDGYAIITEINGILYAQIIGEKGNSAICYPLLFDDERNLIFN